MKKSVVLTVLLVLILSSVVTGTLASYTIRINDFARGSVVAKEFIFLEDGADSFEQNVKIAPTETMRWQCAVKNYDGSVITDMALNYDITFDVEKQRLAL